MASNIVVPDLGESVIEATVARWLKKEGEPVRAGEAVVELETDKVDLDVAAEADGVLSSITVAEGTDVKVGDVLGVIDAAGGAQAPAAPAEQEAQAAASTRGGPEIEAVTVEDEDLPEQPEEQASREPRAEAPQAEKPTEKPAERATPVARRMAQEREIDLTQVPASGPGSRVTKEDVERFLEKRQDGERAAQEPQPEPQPEAAPVPAPATEPGAGGRDALEERVRMSRRRRTIAQRLVEAQRTAAMLTTFNDVDMTAVMELRDRRKEAFRERHGVGLGIASFFVKAAIGALRDFPQLNAEIQGDEMVIKHYYDIGMAIGASDGLVVPVLRDADRMSFAEIEQAIKEFVDKAQSGNLSLEDLRGGSFTITNGGVFGSLLSTPILNPPQVGILGLHRIEPRPVVVNGEIVVRRMMYLALSYDHRIVDGREAVQFLVRIKELIEDPEKMLLEG